MAFSKLKTALHIGVRLTKTAAAAGQGALKVATGTPMDAYLLRQLFEQMGVTYIKLGQFIASTPSLFPKEFVDAFADCLDNVAPVPFAEIEAVLNSELAHLGGARAFTHIDPVPLAAASIAQVHKAVLPTGEIVAIKVQKQGVGTVINTDLTFLKTVFWVLEKALPSLKIANLADSLNEIRARMLDETDFAKERTHLERFLVFSQRFATITAPKPYAQYSTKRVLTMQFLDGKSLLVADIAHPDQIMSSVLDAWLLSVTELGEFHADLHAGNLLLLNDNRVAFVDFGLVGRIPSQSLDACFLLAQAFGENDARKMAQAMIAMGATHHPTQNQSDDAAINHLANDLARLLGKGARTPLGGVAKDAKDNASDLTLLMNELKQTARKHGIALPKDFALLTKQFLYFDRFIRTLAPDVALFDPERLTDEPNGTAANSTMRVVN